jgi:hypothetical protein
MAAEFAYKKQLDLYNLNIAQNDVDDLDESFFDIKKQASVGNYSEMKRDQEYNIYDQQIFSLILDLFKRIILKKKFLKDDIYLYLILVSSICYLIFFAKIFFYELPVNLYYYCSFTLKRKKYKIAFLIQLDQLISQHKERKKSNTSTIITLQTDSSVNNFTKSSSLSSQDTLVTISNEFEKESKESSFDNESNESSFNDVNIEKSLIEYLSKKRRRIDKLTTLYANLCAKLEMCDKKNLIPDIWLFVEWVLIIEDAKKRLNAIKKKNKFVYTY